MNGPFRAEDVKQVVKFQAPGVYLLSTDGRHADYVARSDTDVGARVADAAQETADEYPFFWFEYATSPHQAFALECCCFHQYDPPHNTFHPVALPGAAWQCPVSGCRLSQQAHRCRERVDG